MSNESKRPTKGFTLIELLVVIAIIAMLLAILMPALGKVKAIAKDVIGRTNIKSMQLAMLLYNEDYHGELPRYNMNGLWINSIAGYIDDMDKVRHCPATTINRAAMADKWGTTYVWGSSKKSWIWNVGTEEPEAGSYGFSSWFYTYDREDQYPVANKDKYFRKMGKIRSPGMTPIFADSLWVDVGVSDTDTCPDGLKLSGSPNSGGRMSMHLLDRHGSHINIGFADGHQEKVELGALWSLKWYNNFKTQGWVTRPDGTPIYQK